MAKWICRRTPSTTTTMTPNDLEGASVEAASDYQAMQRLLGRAGLEVVKAPVDLGKAFLRGLNKARSDMHTCESFGVTPSLTMEGACGPGSNLVRVSFRGVEMLINPVTGEAQY